MNSIHAQKEIKELLLTPRIIAQLFFLAFLNSFFALIVFAFEHLEALSKYNFQYEIKFIGFFYVIVLCSYAFKTEFHKHHKFAIIIIISLEIVLSVFSIITFSKYAIGKKETIALIGKCFLIPLSDVYFSTRYVIEKFLMDKKFLSPYLLLSIEGGISTVINILLMLILSNFMCYAFFFKRLLQRQNSLFYI